MMNQQWHNFLTSEPMEFDSQDIAMRHPAQPFPTPGQSTLLTLDCLAVMELKGANAITALQGQITQDARRLSQGKWIFTDICTPKGRIMASALAIPFNAEHICLLVDRAQSEQLHTHLNKFFAFHRVSLSLSNQWIPLGFAHGEGAKSVQSARLSSQLSVELHTLESATALWSGFGGGKAASALWDQLLMQHGICWVGADLSDQYTPHHLGHPGLDFVSFKKGCYTGQEIIARMEYKAQLKSRLCWLETDAQLEQQELTDPAGQTSGKWIKGRQIASDRWLYCADIRITSLEQSTTWQCSGKNLHLVPVPYAINN